jgi:hypothetical protein
MRSEAVIDTVARAKKLREYIAQYSPVDTGALKGSWSDPRTVQILPSGEVEIDNPLPYARIQDLGGVIHRISSKGKAYMIRIRGHHYVQKAIDRLNAEVGKESPIHQPPGSIIELLSAARALVEAEKTREAA